MEGHLLESLPATSDAELPESAHATPDGSPATLTQTVSGRRQEGAEVPPPMPWSVKAAMLTATIGPPVGLIAAIWLLWNTGWVGPLHLGVAVVLYLLTACGITVGFHRLMTHKSFETYNWVRALWMIAGAMSVQGSPLVWCSVHRRHHLRSDQPGDPHSPHLHGETIWGVLQGLAYAQVGWLFAGYWSDPQPKRYVPDLLKDPLLVGLDRIYWFWVLLSLALPAAIGGLITLSWHGALLGFLWGGLVRIFLVHHVTWSINSICHVFGTQEYKSSDQSKNNVICGVLAQGEGWHNNHHAFPSSARHGLKWWQFDSSWLIIKGMEAVGLAWNIRVPTEAQLNAKRLK